MILDVICLATGQPCGGVLVAPIPLATRSRFKPGVDILAWLPTLLAALYCCLSLNGVLEATFFHGNFPQWLYETVGVRYDPRNSLVVGFAMGFAVIPIIYTICEDALSNVPQHLISGSLALGATRWQTAIRVVLPTASPGLFSAVDRLWSCGRETMIVLMATGNTPVMDFSHSAGFARCRLTLLWRFPRLLTQHSLSYIVSCCVTALCAHFCHKHRGRAGAAAAPRTL